MKMSISTIVIVLGLTLSAQSASAGYTFLFVNDSTGLAQNSYNLNVGQSQTVDVYLQQTGASTGLSAQGLNSAGVQLNSTPTATTPAAETQTTANSAFDSSNTTTGVNAKVTENQVFSNPVKAASNQVLLGSFTFTGQSAGTTTVNTAIPNTGTNVNVIAPGGSDSGSIDSMIQGASAVFNVAAVPEPGSLVLAGLAACGFGMNVLRRRFLRKPQPTAAA